MIISEDRLRQIIRNVINEEISDYEVEAEDELEAEDDFEEDELEAEDDFEEDELEAEDDVLF